MRTVTYRSVAGHEFVVVLDATHKSMMLPPTISLMDPTSKDVFHYHLVGPSK